MRTIARMAVYALVVASLAGCGDGSPSESNMKQALRDNQKFMTGLMFLMAAQGHRDGEKAAGEAMTQAVLDKSGCAQAQGAPGFICDFRLGQKTDSGVQYGPPGKGRFFKSGDGWAMELMGNR